MPVLQGTDPGDLHNLKSGIRRKSGGTLPDGIRMNSHIPLATKQKHITFSSLQERSVTER